jgi:magnesium and cobalt transporter
VPNGGRVSALAPRDLRVNLRKLRNMRVDDVSVPRADIVAVPVDASLDEIVAVFRSSELSRLPVYSEALDQPLGLVHLKDLALGYGFGAAAPDFALRDLLRPLLYAPPSMPIGVLLQKMQAARIHMALVIDEYGGVDGLVTIEDLLEQIVGDISDEHDEAESALWTAEAPGVFLAEARMDLEDFEAVAGVVLADPGLAEEVDTIGGLVFRLAGRVPVRGEVVMHPAGHEFDVLDADARKIERLRVRLRQASDAMAEAAE